MRDRQESLIALSALTILAACAPSGGDRSSLSGSATLPDCKEAPAFDFDGTEWTTSGTATVTSEGCEGLIAGDQLEACFLNWSVAQEGNELSIVSDEEFNLRGRICRDQVFLTGGWWLPFPNDEGVCAYADDDGVVVTIEDGSTALTITQSQFDPTSFTMVGTLQLRDSDNAGCTASFTLTLNGPVPQFSRTSDADEGQVWIVEAHPSEPELWDDPRAGILLRSLDGGIDRWLPAAALLADGPAVIDVEPGAYGASLVVGQGFVPARLERVVEVVPGRRESLSVAELTKAFRALR